MAGPDTTSRFLDDWSAGEVFETAPYTMAQDEIIDFATRYDPQIFHTDARAARDTIYGGLIASGWHSCAVMMRLLTTLIGQASLGSPGCESLEWLAPVRPGDRVRLRVHVDAVVASTTKPDRGIIRCVEELVNQDDVIVVRLRSNLLMRRRPPASG